jgi:hypothetical protein
MIDLHLFLPRPLQNMHEGPPPAGEVFYGNIPQHELDVLVEQCKLVVDRSADCVRLVFLSLSIAPPLTSGRLQQALTRSMTGATKLYIRTRAPASKTSVRRSKGIDMARIHPQLSALLPRLARLY